MSAALVILFLVCNRCIVVWSKTSDLTLASFGIASRTYAFIVLPLWGTMLGFLTIVGYNMGARKIRRVREAVGKALIAVLAVSLVELALFLPLADYIAMIFGGEEAAQREAAMIIRIIIAGISSLAFQGTVSFVYQSLQWPVLAIFFTILRIGLLLVPLMLLFVNVFKSPLGLWVAYPVADVLTALICAPSLLLTVFCGPLQLPKGERCTSEPADGEKELGLVEPSAIGIQADAAVSTSTTTEPPLQIEDFESPTATATTTTHVEPQAEALQTDSVGTESESTLVEGESDSSPESSTQGPPHPSLCAEDEEQPEGTQPEGAEPSAACELDEHAQEAAGSGTVAHPEQVNLT